jgi:hypothetical protein
MPFWQGWNDPYTEPKRPFRFVVPMPVFVPHGRFAGIKKISDIVEDDLTRVVNPMYNAAYPGDGGAWPEFFATSCTKPGFKTDVYKSDNVLDGFPKIFHGQATFWNFDPVTVELIDTYDQDLASTLTTYLLAGSGVKPNHVQGTAVARLEGKLIPFSNCMTGESRFEIIELLEHTANPGAPLQKKFKARKYILHNPYISSVDFGTFNSTDEDFTKVKITLAYDSYDYEFIHHRGAATESHDNRIRIRRDALSGRHHRNLRKYEITPRQRRALAEEGS